MITHKQFKEIAAAVVAEAAENGWSMQYREEFVLELTIVLSRTNTLFNASLFVVACGCKNAD